jgi:hypothetical protein
LRYKEVGHAKNHWNWAHSNDKKPFEKKPWNGERRGYQGNNPRPNYNSNYRSR